MHKYCLSILIIASLILINGCQTSAPSIPFIPSPQQQPSRDTVITTAVLESMLNNENTANLGVHVDTNNSVVSLSGYVKTIRQSDTLEEIARQTLGVTAVQNNIIVRK